LTAVGQTVPAALAAPAARVHTRHPGDVVCVDRDERMETLLGSCVSIVLTDPRRTVGAMCHVVHSRPPLQGGSRNTAHGDAALLKLFGQLRAKGIEPRLCHAWIYGGGNMFPGRVGAAASQGNVGAANAAWAVDAMAQAGIHVLGGEMGGNAYRKLRWTVGPGEPELQAVSVDAAGAPT
jgi:chemotaxis protein CheD